MSERSAEERSVIAKWAPVVAGAATAGIVVGQASDRMGLALAVALGVLVGLAAAAGVYALLHTLARRG